MKRLLLIRHAKSDWSDPLASDDERALNERGRRDAPVMGRRIGERGWAPDAFVCSSARRARETAEAMAPGMPFPLGAIDFCDRLYLARPEVMMEIIHRTPRHVGTLALLAHNPGISHLAADLCPDDGPVDMPTASVISIVFDADDWADVHRGRRVDFDDPKRAAMEAS